MHGPGCEGCYLIGKSVLKMEKILQCLNRHEPCTMRDEAAMCGKPQGILKTGYCSGARRVMGASAVRNNMA